MHSLDRGTSPTITVRVSKEMLAKLDRHRTCGRRLSRSSFVRWALTELLVDLEELEGTEAK